MTSQSAVEVIGEAPGPAPTEEEMPNLPAAYVMNKEDADEVEEEEGKEVVAVEEKEEGRPARKTQTCTRNGGQTR